MKLFYYDLKHNEIHDELELGNLTKDQEDLVDKIIEFLNENEILDGRYKNLILAQNITKEYDPETGFSELMIEG